MRATFGDKKLLIRQLSLKDLRQPEKLCDFVNSLVDEDAKILANSHKVEKDELAWLRGELLKMKEKRGIRLFVEYNGQIVANTGVALRRERESHIGELGISIRDGFRGIGLGSYLIGEIIKMAKQGLKPPPKIIELGVFENNKAALHVYRKAGFREVARIPNRIQYKGQLITEIIMHLSLS
ncbi:MAG: GNAT family N-acetyltransferase [Candidatus Pacebacteria bacterium]|nr:GNAT family N-acetyltransferase [Candidatus Paceibacterota bacterium]